MLKSLLLIAMLTCLGCVMIPAASSDPTFWWRTTDGAVVGTQHSQQCSLIMFNGTQAVIATWDRTASPEIRLEDNSWHFFANTPLPLTLVIGDTRLSGTAIGTSTYLAMLLSQSIEPILAHASAIDANYTDNTGIHRFSFSIDQTKMPALLKAVARCRKSP